MQAASFDCKKAGTMVEKFICGDYRLSLYDNTLAKLYKREMNKTKDKKSIKQQQRDWLKSRNLCEDSVCIARAYVKRINWLSSSGSSAIDAEAAKVMASVTILDENFHMVRNKELKKHPYVLVNGGKYEVCRTFTNYLNSDYYKKGDCAIGEYPADTRLKGIKYKRANALDYADFYLHGVSHISDQDRKQLEIKRRKELLESGNVSVWIGAMDIGNSSGKDAFLVARYFLVKEGIHPQFCENLGGGISRLVEGKIDNGAWGGNSLPEPFVFDGNTFFMEYGSNGENIFSISELPSSVTRDSNNKVHGFDHTAITEICDIRESIFYIM